LRSWARGEFCTGRIIHTVDVKLVTFAVRSQRHESDDGAIFITPCRARLLASAGSARLVYARNLVLDPMDGLEISLNHFAPISLVERRRPGFVDREALFSHENHGL
jgi:hypothetical protein